MFKYSKILVILLVSFLSSITPSQSIDTNMLSTDIESLDQLPPDYKLEINSIKPIPYLNLDRVSPLKDVPQHILESWEPSNLKLKKYMIVKSMNFLDYSLEGFNLNFKDYLVGEKANSSKPYYFSAFWNVIWDSAELILSTRHFDGGYGVILEIPPQLILETYPEDTATLPHGGLLNRIREGGDVDEIVTSISSWSRVHFPFLTPDDMITNTRGRNEIKFVHKGIYEGKEYRVKITGLFYRAIPDSADRVIDSETIEKLQMIARELNIPLIPLPLNY
jgi:hypothetical protein